MPQKILTPEKSLFLKPLQSEPSFPVALYEDQMTNEHGCIRRSLVYPFYEKGEISNDDVKKLYTTWRDDPEYIILRGIVEEPYMQERLFQNNSGFGDTWYLDPKIDYVYRCIKASKRGNDVYKHQVTDKLKPLKDLRNITFFDDHDVHKRTCLLFITLTYDTKICDSHTAWSNIANEYHLFLSNVLKQFGDIEFFRAWESTKNYYPHIHVAILFRDRDFLVIPHLEKKKNGDSVTRYRIPYKEKQHFSKYWHSNIDIQALKSTGDCFKELTKYITKDLCSDKGDKTNSMIWLYRKQSYAISHKFIEAIQGWYIDFNEPTNLDLIRNYCNCNSDGLKWEILGMLRGRDLRISPDIWFIDFKKPPPRIADLIENESIRWNRLHRGNNIVTGRFDDYNSNRKIKIPCNNCGSTNATKSVLGVWVCKKCLDLYTGDK